MSVDQLHTLPAGSTAAVLTTQEGKPFRLDYNSYVRFRRRDGSDTRWMRAGDLFVGDRGVAVRRHLAFSEVRRARVSGMDEDVRRFLRELGDPTTVRELPDGEIELVLPGPKLLDLFGRLSVLVAEARGALTHADRSAWESVCLAPKGDAARSTLSDLMCASSLPATAQRFLWRKDKRLPFGRWSFDLPPNGYQNPLEGELLFFDSLRAQSFDVIDGLEWPDLISAEIANVSAGKTFGQMVATVGIAALMAPLGFAAQFGSAIGARSSPGAANAAGIATAIGGGSRATESDPTEGLHREGLALWQPELAAPRSQGARLFSSRAIRAGVFRAAAFLDAGNGTEGLSLQSSVAGVLRFVSILEVGADARNLLLARTAPGSSYRSSYLGFFRLGFHLPVDPWHRAAIQFSVDLGGGGDVKFQVRTNMGMRFRLGEHFLLGAYVLNPSATLRRPEAGSQGAGVWSFPSGIEMGALW